MNINAKKIVRASSTMLVFSIMLQWTTGNASATGESQRRTAKQCAMSTGKSVDDVTKPGGSDRLAIFGDAARIFRDVYRPTKQVEWFFVESVDQLLDCYKPYFLVSDAKRAETKTKAAFTLGWQGPLYLNGEMEIVQKMLKGFYGDAFRRILIHSFAGTIAHEWCHASGENSEAKCLTVEVDVLKHLQVQAASDPVLKSIFAEYIERTEKSAKAYEVIEAQ